MSTDGPTSAPPDAAEGLPGLDELLRRAVDLGVRSVGRGGGPFGAVVARLEDGRLVTVAEGENQVTTTHDPTAHAEVVALRAAGAVLGTHELRGCVLLASCEPCPMCLTAGLWARVDAMWFAATRDDAADAGFDDQEFYRAMEVPRERWTVPVRARRVPEPLAPFRAWDRRASRVEY